MQSSEHVYVSDEQCTFFPRDEEEGGRGREREGEGGREGDTLGGS